MSNSSTEFATRASGRREHCIPGCPRPPKLFVVSSSANVHQALLGLLSTAGFDITACSRIDELFSLSQPGGPCCCLLIVDDFCSAPPVRHRWPPTCKGCVPIVLITSQADVRGTVEAMRAGAVDVLVQPVEPNQLLSAIHTAMALSRMELLRKVEIDSLRGRYAALTSRERQVMELVVAGMLNKQVACALGISEITVKAHRGQVMRKMKAKSLPDLVRSAAQLDSEQCDIPSPATAA